MSPMALATRTAPAAAAPAAASCSTRPVLLLLPPVAPVRVLRACPRPFSSTAPRAQQSTKQLDRIPTTQSVDGDESEMCDVDDLDCQSSLAVETVRKFARDVQQLRVGITTPSLFQPDTTYEDGFRRFTGSHKYAKQRWWSEAVQSPVVTVLKMRVLDKTTAQVEWRIRGSMGAAGQVEVPVTSTITLNPLTGRITSHKEQWDLSRLSPPAALLATVQRAAWSFKASAADASEGASKAISDGLSSLDGSEDSSGNYYRDPTDPTKFFQGNQGDSQDWQDYVSYATLAALMYLVFRAYTELAQL